MKYSEGIAFALTAKDNIGSGLAILIAMIVRVIPMKLGYAQILSKSGLSYIQEHLFTTLATSWILIGKINSFEDLRHSDDTFKVVYLALFLTWSRTNDISLLVLLAFFFIPLFAQYFQ